MLSQVFHLLRSKADGSYLVAHPKSEDDRSPQRYLLLFQEYADALSYLNTHGAAVVSHFAVESIPDTQLDSLLKRWGFNGIGLVQDPLLPNVEFLTRG